MPSAEQYADTYIRALDRGDFDTCAMVLGEALADPELERLLVEIDAELHREGCESGMLAMSCCRGRIRPFPPELEASFRPLEGGAAQLAQRRLSGP